MAVKFMVPRTTYIGNGALTDAKDDICKLGKKALIVTGQSMIKQGHMAALTDMLEDNGIEYVIDSKISGEPTDVMISEGAKMYTDNNCDFLIGFGGGSPLDSAKAIGVLVTGGVENISDYNGKFITKPIPPLVAIPSTAGTGSEVTKFTAIADTRNQIKMLLKGDVLIPVIAIVDSQFTMNAPKSVTAATGLDALTHAVEAYTSRLATPQTDLYAISAIKKIFKYLPKAYMDGKDIEAREAMSVAAYEAGICINNSSVTLVHGMSRPIGALFHVPHGISNAMLLKSCLSYALSGAYERFAILGRETGVASHIDSDETAAHKFLDGISDICRICEIPTLEEYGINKDEFLGFADKMAQDAIDSGSPSNTRRNITKENIINIYNQLWE